MAKRYNLNAPPEQTMAELFAEMQERAKSSKTGAHGIKDMGETGDSVWTDPATGEVESTRNVVGKVSEVGIQIEEAKEAITEAEGVIADLKDVRLPALREDLEQAQQEASDSFAALDQKFNEVPTSEELEQVRTNLGAVLTTAQDAQAEAEQASANALAAAGIAADKGRVYYQSSAPTDDASKSVHNLWIDSDDGKVYVWNTATSSWKESESQSLRDAARAALLAQQTADAAVAAAASAMAAAVAAQQTADQSTLDAADAFNAAVAAQDDATDALNKYGPLDQRTIDAQAAAEAAQNAANAAAAVAGEAKTLAQDAVREVGDTVRGTSIQYAVGSSETVAPTTGWSTATPARSPGSFVWMRTIVTYADGDTETTNPVLVTGNAGAPGAKGATGAKGDRGDDGLAGKDGVGLTLTTITYAQNTSGTVAPTTGWTSTVPTLVKGRYLWTKTVWGYSDGTSETGYSVAYVAQDGAKGNDGLPGAPGVGITGTTITYAQHTSGTVAPTTGWAAQPPAAIAGRFLWTKTVWTYSNGTSETGYSVGKIGDTGAKGAKGDKGTDGLPGAPGVGLSTTATTYALHTSGTVAPTAGYTTTVPTLIKGRFLWTRSIWTYTNGTTETGYSVAYVPQDGASGTDGLPGAPGVGITGTAITYAVSSSGTVAPTTGWVAQPPAATAGQYMWTKTVWTYSNNTTETGYSVGRIGTNGTNGAKGDTGDTGIGVSSVTPFFRAVARTAAAPAQPTGMTPSGWTTTEPAWNAANKLYRAERVVYTNSTIAWTAPVLVATYEGIVAVAASANGKNAITLSKNPPVAGTPGVVTGDTWWRIDGDGQIYGQWRWTGSAWIAATIRSEVIANLDVGKLTVTGSSRFTEAVIENLWVNSLVARVATFNRLNVSPGNLIPEADSFGIPEAELDAWKAFGRDAAQGAIFLTGSVSRVVPVGIKVQAGDRFRLTMDVKADALNSTLYFRMWDSAGAVAVTDLVGNRVASASAGDVFRSAPSPINEWNSYEVTFTVPVDTILRFRVYANWGNGTTPTTMIRNMRMQRTVGTVLIENGAVKADQVDAESVGAAVGNFVKARVENLTVTVGATIPDAVIIKLAAEMITSGFFRTSDVGQRVQIDKDGLVMYGVGPDGEDTELVKIGPSGENLITIGDTTVSPDGVRAPQGTFDDLSVGGDSLTDRLNQFPRGIRAWGEITQNSVATAEVRVKQRRAELQTTVEPNRLYRIVVGPRYFEHNYTAATYVTDYIHVSYDSTPIKPWTTPIGGSQVTSGRHYVPNGTFYLVPALEAFINTSGQTGDRVFWAMYTMEAHHGSTYVKLKAGSNHSMLMYLEDIGPAQAGNLKRWNDGSGAVQDPTPIVTRTTKTWNAGGFGGDTRDGKVYQGTFNSRIGNRYGGWVFSSGMRSDLSGSTIEKFEVYLENYHWYYGSGGAAVIYPNDGSYKGIIDSGTVSSGWPRYAGRWVTLPSSWYAHLASGRYKGVSTYTTNTGLTFYGQFKGAPTKFRATYRK